MIDFRILTFLDVCQTRNYTKTAKNLCITQPAVTQHIKYLEEYYDAKLIEYKGKKMHITESGKVVLNYAIQSRNLLKETNKDLDKIKNKVSSLNIGATLTIGEFVMPQIIQKYISQDQKLKINLAVDNTASLIEKLRNGEIDFAFIEGYFNKVDFGYELFKEDEFVLICSKQSELNQSEYTSLEDILDQNIIVREKGSGSRDILEKLLANENLKIEDFNDIMEIGNLKIIVELVKANLGVTFIYKTAVEKELHEGSVISLGKENTSFKREFNFVFMKNTLHKNEYMEFFNFAKEIYQNKDEIT